MGRFRHFGLDMFGFTAALKGVIVQRLLRQLCPECQRSTVIEESQAAIFRHHGLVAPGHLPCAVGCVTCHGTGYAGRFVLAEVHTVDDQFRDLVISGAPLSALKQHAKTMETVSLQSAGLEKVASNVTTMEELQRVVGSLSFN
jgi:general secretion pathway protein E